MADDLASIGVEEFLVSAAAGLASLGYARLEAKDLAEAKLAIDALQSLVPHIRGELQSDLQRALTGLQVAFVDASSG
ncbi:MAG TPA: hypothetical protein VFJ93_04805 [Gaiellaceae bacterium]|nr:hypothetical protein [Gaiellaceae bacterium]